MLTAVLCSSFPCASPSTCPAPAQLHAPHRAHRAASYPHNLPQTQVILAIVASAYEEAKDLQMEQLASPHTVALAVRMPFFQFVGSVIGFYARWVYVRS